MRKDEIDEMRRMLDVVDGMIYELRQRMERMVEELSTFRGQLDSISGELSD